MKPSPPQAEKKIPPVKLKLTNSTENTDDVIPTMPLKSTTRNSVPTSSIPSDTPFSSNSSSNTTSSITTPSSTTSSIITPETTQQLQSKYTTSEILQKHNNVTIVLNLFDTHENPYVLNDKNIPTVLVITTGKQFRDYNDYKDGKSKLKPISTQYQECEYGTKNQLFCKIQLHYPKTEYTFKIEILFDPSYTNFVESKFEAGMKPSKIGGLTSGFEPEVMQTVSYVRVLEDKAVLKDTGDIVYRDSKNSEELVLSSSQRFFSVADISYYSLPMFLINRHVKFYGDAEIHNIVSAFESAANRMKHLNSPLRTALQVDKTPVLENITSDDELDKNWNKDNKTVVISFSIKTASLSKTQQISKIGKIFNTLSNLPSDISIVIVLPPRVSPITTVSYIPWFLLNLRKMLIKHIKKLRIIDEENALSCNYCFGREIVVVDAWQFTCSQKRISETMPKPELYIHMIEDLVPMICKNCIDMKDAVLEYPTDSEKSVSKSPEIPMTCNDSTCTIGKWTNCIDKPSTVSRATLLFNSYRMNKPNRTLLTVPKNETLCGESNQLNNRVYNLTFNSNTYCDTESDTPCCKHFMPENTKGYSDKDTCVAKTECDPYNWYDVDLNDYKQAEACEWKPEVGDFRVLTGEEARKKLHSVRQWVF